MTTQKTEFTYEWLQDLKEAGTARIIETKEEGCVQLWEVDEDNDRYVVLSDNSVITQTEDNALDGEEGSFFPLLLGTLNHIE